MHIARMFLVLTLFGLVWIPKAIGAVDTVFVDAGRYTDPNLYGGYGERAREPALREIRSYLEQLGERYLRPGQRLEVEVLDIDLAGHFEPWRFNTRDTRVLREVTWPRIKMRYTLREDGAALLSAEETVSGLNYLMDTTARYSSATMSYEKAMLRDWFQARFADRQPPPA